MKVQIIKDLLPSHTLLNAMEIEFNLRNSGEGNYCNEFKRYWIHKQSFFDFLHRTIVLDRAKSLWGNDIKPSYSGVSIYTGEDSICPPHFDRPQCRYSIDLCLRHTDPWGIFVNGKQWIMDEGEALAYSGTHDFHWRDRCKPGNKVTMAFFHYVDSDFSGPLD